MRRQLEKETTSIENKAYIFKKNNKSKQLRQSKVLTNKKAERKNVSSIFLAMEIFFGNV